ncbi:hypothetical protein M4I21_16725 [Cellulophaga sp. 20_2_10]|uniref:hypothetical protein n=1 Tax=Cellulophaga sp. 20_2_10 TaxID=2942476 RepID=UPI00201B06C4|nr:hypothetical protein [Cellulophaga sp. 20_2_10]MCL5247467.1 hypothetical protein [Cellulophaga sp. 20_2_10]
MQKTDEYIASRLVWKAEQYKLPTEYSFYFKNITQKKKDYYSEYIINQNIGIPTLLLTQPNSTKWTIIGTRKIVWGDTRKSESLLFSNIKKINTHSLNSKEEMEEVFNGALPKMEWNELTLTKKSDEKAIVYALKGSDFFAMWNIIRMVWQLNSQ